ncbi:helix-turn-helix domain-containing protein [Bacillus sp. E(2018)]|uniref:AraC family transcriptional regulator n=1 Tax=Bacillus sp. E(2018) TaxID=2502239 RepID=UPI0010F97AA0|nr:helix-turn-helix domain-containing protein [Bacillus sp. E(2018)]
MNVEREQRKQIFRVLEYIEEHVEDSLPLEKLAGISTYSPFHFQRIFKSVVGETPAAYVKRFRLENAAHRLIYETYIPITQIAMLCGFSSLSYFTYSFQSYFKTSPKNWREGAYLKQFPREYEDSKKSKQVRNPSKVIESNAPYNEFKWLDLSNIRIETFPSSTTIKGHHFGTYTSGVSEAWEEVHKWCESRNLIDSHSLFLGIPRNNPYITPPDKCRYDCHMTISETIAGSISADDTSKFVGGKHVVYEFDEPVDYSERNLIIDCYSELYSYWLPRSGYKYLSNPIEIIQIQQNNDTLQRESKIKAIALAIEPK